MKIYDFKDPDVFKKLEKMCFVGGLDVSPFPPAAYRYFSELIKLYDGFKSGDISEQDAKSKKSKLYADYRVAIKDYENWIEVWKKYSENIRLSEVMLSEIEREKDVSEIALKASKIISLLTSDESFFVRQNKKIHNAISITREEFIKLIGKDVIVDYPIYCELQKWSMKSFAYDPVTDKITHNRLDIDCEVFIKNARNPHVNDEATHG